jgi:hypothetical protein
MTILDHPPVDLGPAPGEHDARLAELVRALSGCSADVACNLVLRTAPWDDPLDRVAAALTTALGPLLAAPVTARTTPPCRPAAGTNPRPDSPRR